LNVINVHVFYIYFLTLQKKHPPKKKAKKGVKKGSKKNGGSFFLFFTLKTKDFFSHPRLKKGKGPQISPPRKKTKP